jgi:hypothetical protein
MELYLLTTEICREFPNTLGVNTEFTTQIFVDPKKAIDLFEFWVVQDLENSSNVSHYNKGQPINWKKEQLLSESGVKEAINSSGESGYEWNYMTLKLINTED